VAEGSVGVAGTVGEVRVQDWEIVEMTHFLYLWNNSSTWELRYNELGDTGSTLLDSGQIWSYDFSN
jgi:hypothetical protein